jgi:beta-glucosidase
MCAYPSVNGRFMCENKHLLTDVLRGQWGFTGFVQSDASATHTAVGSADAGQDLELRDHGPYDEQLKQAVLDGRVSTQALDTMIVRRLTTEIAAGLFDRPATVTPIDAAAGGAVARTVAEQSAVLLKNSGGALPLRTGGLHSVAVIGPFAASVHPGGGGSSHVNPLYTVTPVQAIQNRVGAGVTVGTADGTDLTAASALAGSSDVAVVIVGDVEREGADRPNLSLSGDQDALVRSVVAANPHTIVVLNTGAPVLMPWVDDVPAVLEAWYPGEEDGNALAGLLFGDVNPSGKLPVTFPRTETQTPVSTPERYPGVNGTVQYSEKLEMGYRWYDAQGQDPLFPFGFGLSYTSFSFGHLRVTPVLGPGGHVTVDADVTNTGSRAGAEVVQVYLTDPASSGEPPRQLKGFSKVSLRPGERGHVRLTLDERAFSIWDSAAQRWTTVRGRYQVSVGDSSRNLPLSAPVTVPFTVGAQAVQVSAPRLVSPGETVTASTMFTNTGDLPVWRGRIDLDPPAGWTATPVGRTSFEVVPGHSAVRTDWRVSVPASAVPVNVELTAHASYQTLAGIRDSSGLTDVSVPYLSVDAARTNVGISPDTDTSVANFDGGGSSISAQALAAAGVTPGGQVTHSGATFTWPASPTGQPDNVVAAGQAIRVSGTGSTLNFLAASTSGPATGPGTLVYSDGSTAAFTLSATDWFVTSAPPGTDPAIVMTYRNRTGNTQQTHAVTVFALAVPLAAGRTLAGVVLPDFGAAVTSGSPAMHVFAVAVA